MVKYWYISGDFLTDRSRRIGASDIPALIPNPERPTETLAGYDRTPVTVWQEKTGKREREPAGFPAEMGHYLEGKALEVFIRTYADKYVAGEFLKGWQSYLQKQTVFRHHVQFHRDGMITHPDMVYDPEAAAMSWKRRTVHHGIAVKFDQPFIVEAKSASYWSARRPEGSIVKGYDPKLKTWQGIPLAHYMQIQFQLALLEVDVAYLPLIHNTNQFDVWQIRANKKHQGQLIDLAGRMVHHIETDTPPGNLAINAKDIISLYPEVGDDFVIINDEERDRAVEIAQKYRHAEKQEKMWGAKKDDAKDAMAVMLKDRPELRDGEGPIAKWRIARGSERITSLKKLKAEDPAAYKYLQRKSLLYTSADSRTVSVTWRDE